MIDLSISEAAELLRQKKISPVDLTAACLDRIERLNPVLNAFITVTREGAMAGARVAEDEIQRGQWRGPLHGIPIGLKDLIDTAGVRTTCGSALFADQVPTEDAYVVQRLKRAGAVLLGKQNLQEFAYGGTSASSHFGAVHNPWNPKHIAGGSSGGSAAAVAAGMCFGAIGSDTGGSIREPAAFCGVVGLKPTYGRVSTRGVFPLSWSLDHVGPICRNVRDAALMLEAIAGYDALDPTCVDWPIEQYANALSSKTDFRRGLRIGLARQPFFEDLDADIELAINEAIEVIRKMSAVSEARPSGRASSLEVIEVDLPSVPTAVQAPEVYAVHTNYYANSPELYRPWMRERLAQAANADTASYVADRFALERVRRTISDVFTEVDLLITPTTPVPPITIEEASNMSPNPAGEIWLRNTRPFNAYGLPTISIPCGFTKAGLPIGLQIAGPRFGEGRVLAFAHVFEQATDWHKRAPTALPKK
ncbi:MAG: aspartyl-tRNA(Asn)/glutamyl-tRNA(Gln) amidotransferase subunit [Blastocatellia bacterium]|jgi:aspartyl-tRNA(Asn)/glutamyl-tRNA(Gln) amidotransferase subunit A|nr:aspartyl-tRNA(Asn)/glutamyl-tRNA(Gln) amidotransferase subunit [Blastocatellia bacterium]